jgi:signal peptidase I
MKPSEILLLLTVLSGLVCLFHQVWKRRQQRVIQDAGRGGGARVYSKVVDISESFFPVLLLVLLMRSFFFEAFRIPSGSMQPTLLEGDFILVNKYCYGLKVPMSGHLLWQIGAPKRGDVVVFSQGRKDVIKRIVGLPGDNVQYRDKVLYINGKPMLQVFQEDILEVHKQWKGWPFRHYIEHLDGKQHDMLLRMDQQGLSYAHKEYPYASMVVPKDSYYVLGDNRDNSLDSRYSGAVKASQIQGRAVAIFTSIDWENHKLRWNRLFTGIN